MSFSSASRPKPPFPEQPISSPGEEWKMHPAPQFEAPRYLGAGKLKHKVALITGGDSGIGRSVAVLFAREGAEVAIIYLPEEEKDASITAEAVSKEGQRALLLPGDVSSWEFCKAAVTECVEKLGRLDILVNNAAFQKHCSSVEEISLEQWDKTFLVNIYGYFFMVRAALPHLKSGSTIINTSSVTAEDGSEELIDYSSTKGAINAFTKSLAKSLLARGIRVNCVAPGPVWTPLNPAELPPGKTKEIGVKVPMGRPAQPEEISPAYVFLASEVDSSYITGEVLSLLGGKIQAG